MTFIDKLRKIGTSFWYNKERMVLVLMLVVLAYRVYGVINPEPPQTWPRLPSPQTLLPEDPAERQQLGLPSDPPPPLPMELPGNYVSIYENNPFWYYSGRSESTGTQTVTAEDLGIRLLDIQDAGGRPRARLRTVRTTAWYSENEQFEEYELLRIDPETQTVEVYSEKYKQKFTLKKR